MTENEKESMLRLGEAQYDNGIETARYEILEFLEKQFTPTIDFGMVNQDKEQALSEADFLIFLLKTIRTMKLGNKPEDKQ